MTEHVEHVEAVVVGSGFGGAVAAYRLAEAGVPVVVLERGRAYGPGDFARSPSDMGRAFWDPSAGLRGLFDVWSFSGCDSVVASGLGGGSLIYANVLLRKDEKWFVNDEALPNGGYESWPVTRAELDPHYDAVERMLGATPFPLERPAYAGTAKAHALQDAAAQLGLDWRLPPLAVSFAPAPDAEPGLGLPIAEPEYGNLHGKPRVTCRLCGECDIGCNDGSKNSLDHTYLSAASFHGADLRTGHEVRAIRPSPTGGYEVDYVRHDAAGEAMPSKALPVRTIHCERLILAAGTFGTSYLLLRARDRFPGLSPALGTRFCGNGDLLTFLLRAKDRGRLRTLDASRGPVITSAIRLPDDLDGGPGSVGRGAYIEDGGYPGFVDWLVESADMTRELSRAARFAFERLRAFWSHDSHISREMAELIGKGALSVSSLPLLGMGRDVPDGVLRLDGKHLEVDWTMATSAAFFERMRTTMRRIADVLGAEYADNPVWFRKRIITVHPVGGAPMGEHAGVGVCDSHGEVHGFPGLYIADGAAMPGPVGPNPSLTIAALADRMSSRLLERRATAPTETSEPIQGGSDGRATCAPVRIGGDTARTSLSFTEEMQGYYASGVSGPRAGDVTGRRLGQRFAFRLTITADDVDRFLAEPEHTARAEGWIDAAGFGGRRPVQRGWFNLFSPADAPDRRLMRYRLHFTDDADRPRTLAGWKNVFHGPPTDIWPDTSTLFFRVLEGHVADGGDDGAAIVGAGTLHIQITEFMRQLTTFRTQGPHRLAALERFGAFFAGRLWDVYRPEHPAPEPPAEPAEPAEPSAAP